MTILNNVVFSDLTINLIDMKSVELKDEYRSETNKDVYSENIGGMEGSYSDEYVKWLESKLKNNDVLDIVILSDQQKKEEYDKGFCDGHNAGCEQIMDSSI